MTQLQSSIKITNIFFNCYCLTTNFWRLSRGKPDSPDANHCVCFLTRPVGHREPRNEVGSRSTAEHLVELKWDLSDSQFNALTHQATFSVVFESKGRKVITKVFRLFVNISSNLAKIQFLEKFLTFHKIMKLWYVLQFLLQFHGKTKQ